MQVYPQKNRRLLIMLLWCMTPLAILSQVVAFYNCENYYDTTNQLQVNDEEFLPSAAKAYSALRYRQKTTQLSRR